MRRAALLAIVVLAACSSSNPVVQRPTRTSSPTPTSSASVTPNTSGSALPTATPSGAAVYEFSGGQASLDIRGDFSFAGSHLLDRGFSEPPSGGEADGTYGWFDSAGDRLVLNVPNVGRWTVSGVIDGTQISFQECTVSTERNDPGGMNGSFTCARVTRSGTATPSGTARATFSLEP